MMEDIPDQWEKWHALNQKSKASLYEICIGHEHEIERKLEAKEAHEHLQLLWAVFRQVC